MINFEAYYIYSAATRSRVCVRKQHVSLLTYNHRGLVAEKYASFCTETKLIVYVMFPAYQIGLRRTEEVFPAVIYSPQYPNRVKYTEKGPLDIYVVGAPEGSYVTFSLISPSAWFDRPEEHVRVMGGGFKMKFNSSIKSPGSIQDHSPLVTSYPNDRELHPIFLLKYKGEFS